MGISFKKIRNGYLLHTNQWIPLDLKSTFNFFSDAYNLAKITPLWLGMQIISPESIKINKGSVIMYRIKLLGIPVTWVSQITAFKPPVMFRDVQLKGPYKRWEHTHTMKAEGDGTRIMDEVVYEMPYGFIGALVHFLLVKRQLTEIFEYRELIGRELLESRKPEGSKAGKGKDSSPQRTPRTQRGR